MARKNREGNLVTSFKTRFRNLPSMKRNIMNNQNCDSNPAFIAQSNNHVWARAFLLSRLDNRTQTNHVLYNFSG